MAMPPASLNNLSQFTLRGGESRGIVSYFALTDTLEKALAYRGLDLGCS